LAFRRKKPQVAGSATAIAGQTKTGVTYQAGKSALAQIPRPQLDTEFGSSQPVPIRELVPELSTQFQRTTTYARMMNDAGVDVSVRALKTPVLGAEFFVEPYSDDPQDKLVAEFIWENLAKGMSAPMLNALEDILHYMEDGYSVIEKVYENREWSPSAKGGNTRQYTMLKKLGVRPATTIKEITYDNNGGPTQVVQNAIMPDGTIVEKTLPIEKIMVFSFNKRGGDLTGRSILRTAYPHWYYKTHFYKLDAVQKERHGIGVPRGKVLAGAKAEDKAQLRTLLRNLRTNEEAYIIQVPSIEIDFAELTGNPVDIISSAEHHNMMIMLNVMAQFIMLGLQAGGGRATAATGSDLFMKSLKYAANYIAQVVNMYLIPELVVWNFPTRNYPELKVRNIGETRDLQMLGAALANLFAQDGLTPDLDTENWIRETFDMPHKNPEAAPSMPVTRRSIMEQIYTGKGSIPPDQQGKGQQGNGAVSETQTQKGNIKPGAVKSGNVGAPPNAPR